MFKITTCVNKLHDLVIVFLTRKSCYVNIRMSDNAAIPFLIPEGSSLSTFSEDDSLPSLPLPTLEATLEKYLDSVKPFLTAEELENTNNIVEDFFTGSGRYLHEKLADKAANSRNWLEQYWIDVAYLLNRKPLVPFSSFTGWLPKELMGYPTGTLNDQIHNAAFHMHILMQFWTLLRSETLSPFVLSAKTRFDMSQYRRLFNSCRLPGKDIDSLQPYFKTEKEGDCPSHIIVCYKGHFLKIDSKGAILTPPSIAAILYSIKEKYTVSQPSVAILTSANRPDWYKYRNKLMSLSERNVKSLETLDSAVSHFILDDSVWEEGTEMAARNFAGYIGDRWFDKSHLTICYGDGTIAGVSEHTPYDGMVGYTFNLYSIEKAHIVGPRWKDEMPTDGSTAGEYEEVAFDIDDEIKEAIKVVAEESKADGSLVKSLFPTFADFGKEEIAKTQMHPDSFIQLALQLAYVRQHGRPAPCYESATTRQFYHGRTETVRSCTPECVKWVNSMLDPKAPLAEKAMKLMGAALKHAKLMKEACNNEGCDRHLLGLQLVAQEEGLPLHDLFKDPAYSKSGGGANFILSTSLTGFSKTTAIVAPMVTDGYGVFYGVSTDRVVFGISTFTNSTETNDEEFFKNISTSLWDMKNLIADAHAAGLKPPARTKQQN